MSSARALVGLAWRQLWYHRRSAGLAVVGVALAVLLCVLLVGLAYGLFTTGGEAITWISRDLWVTGEGIGLAPGTVGGVETPVRDAHVVAADITARQSVAAAQPIALLSVYVSPNTSSFETTVGVGSVGSQAPDATATDRLYLNDSHYANGSYDGPMTHEIIIDEGTADRFDVGVNDTLYVGGTLATARENEFRIVAVSGRYSTFLGTRSVAMPLSELQEITGTTGTDPAAFIGVSLRPGADADAVSADIEREYPELVVRNNDEQVQRIIGGQAAVVVGMVALVVLAVVSGVALVVNVLVTLVRSQRAELAALRAAGVSVRSLVAVVVAQGALLGLAGGLVGVAVGPLAVDALNVVLAGASGFADLAKTPAWVYLGSLGLATVMGTLGATVAGWQLSRLSPLAHLR